jgi:hypothetical protein
MIIKNTRKEGSNNIAGVCLSFDDLYVTEWLAVHNYIIGNGVSWKANFNIYGTGATAGQWTDLATLVAAGHELATHTSQFWQNQRGLDRAVHFTAVYAKPEYDAIVAKGYTPHAFIYGGGSHSAHLDDEILNGGTMPATKLIRSGSGAPVYFTGQTLVQGRGLDAFYGTGGFSTIEELITSIMETAERDNKIAVFYAHRPISGTPAGGSYTINYDTVQHVAEEAVRLGIPMYNWSDLAGMVGNI